MSKMLTLLLASFPSLVKLFFLCRCPSPLCFSLVLFLLFLGVGFKLSLIPFWGYLSLILHVIICFIGMLESSKMRLSRLFTYPLTKFFETQQMNSHGFFSSYYPIGVCVILKEVNLVIEKILFASEGLWWATGLLFKKNLHIFHVRLVLTIHGKNFYHSFSPMSNFKESW